MADFIAVIRRAVDGLNENTPEMRVKVYERARSAVIRQLENMKPRPPEVMFQRQMDKLDAAIAEVEAEHAEAIADDSAVPVEPPVDEPVAELPGNPAETVEETTPALAEPAAAEPDIAVEPAYAKQDQPEPVYEEPVEVPEPQPFQPESRPVADEVTAFPYNREPEAVIEVPAETRYQPFDVLPPAPADEPVERVTEPVDNVVAEPPLVAEPIGSTEAADVQDPAPVVEEPVVAEAGLADPAFVDEPQPEEPAQADARQEPTPAMPRVSYDEADVVAGFNDFVQQEINRKVVPPPPGRKGQPPQNDFSWDAPFDDLPEIAKPVSFEKALEAKQKEIGAGTTTGAVHDMPAAPPATARDELEDLLGIDRSAEKPAALASANGDVLPPEVTRVVSKLEGKSFKVPKNGKRDRNRSRLLPIALGAAAVLIVAGGASALWLYKDEVSSLMARILPAEQPETSAVPADAATEATPVVAKTEETPKLRTATAETEVASLDTKAGVQKFTQRLMPDGTEAETETASVPVDQALPEGKTVAGQTEPGKKVAEAATDTQTDATATATEQPAVAPLAATQKMFLYEERLGQASPVAVPGTVLWREKTDTENGKPNPSAEAQIDIPDRKMKALISFKRNTDASLPASHIIEIVFALPKDFEEGNVDSVQRVAFKQTEQDRGNPLIAVPAKITDDFHMVALNDDAEARKVNLDLMKNRSWIDIPVTYRNGRRALITLEKGATGTAVFNKVLAEWDALGPQTRAN
jgi:hypothetical protein